MGYDQQMDVGGAAATDFDLYLRWENNHTFHIANQQISIQELPSKHFKAGLLQRLEYVYGDEKSRKAAQQAISQGLFRGESASKRGEIGRELARLRKVSGTSESYGTAVNKLFMSPDFVPIWVLFDTQRLTVGQFFDASAAVIKNCKEVARQRRLARQARSLQKKKEMQKNAGPGQTIEGNAQANIANVAVPQAESTPVTQRGGG